MAERPILSLVWASGKLGAAFFDLNSFELFVLPDKVESAPDFEIIKLIYRQVFPQIIVVSSRQDTRVIKFLKQLTGMEDHEADVRDNHDENNSSMELPAFPLPLAQYSPSSLSTASTTQRSLPVRSHGLNFEPNRFLASDSSQLSFSDFELVGNHSWGAETQSSGGLRDFNQPGNEEDEDINMCKIVVLSAKEYAPNTCKARLLAQRLPQEGSGGNKHQHTIFINSLVSFRNELMVRASGALLGFLDKNGLRHFRIQISQGEVFVSNIKTFHLQDLVLVDDSAWESLQVFNTEYHPATAKKGLNRNTREGLSVYKLLNRCLTKQGAKMLRLMLLRPTRNLEILNRRFDAIEFMCSPLNFEFVHSATTCLKSIKNWKTLLEKIETLHASINDWRDFYQTVYHLVVLLDVAGKQDISIQLFMDFRNSLARESLTEIASEMMRIIDFEESKACKRFVPNSGINMDLDQTRKQFSYLPRVMTKIAAEEISRLPSYVQQCSIVYVPEIGYLIAINFWAENITAEELQIPNFSFKFANERIAYYKNDRTNEMDAVLGDYQVTLIEQETNIMLGLIDVILKRRATFTEVGSLVSELDCLMSLSRVACDYNFVRPVILDAGANLSIQGGRHPLLNLEMINAFVPNNTEFDQEERIVILTGPNASGKSVYLKQIGTMALMALCGSYVPAVSAQIPAFDRICTRIHTTESICNGLSTFMSDINQIAFATRESTKASLIIVDEFGKGTAEADGMALVAGFLNYFDQKELNCPTVFLSTHFYSIMNFVSPSPLFKLQTMEFLLQNRRITYLYTLKNGMSNDSFAFMVALSAGISEDVIQRCEDRLQNLKTRASAAIVRRAEAACLTPKEEALVDFAEKIIEVPSKGALEFLVQIKHAMESFWKEEDSKVEIINAQIVSTPSNRFSARSFPSEPSTNNGISPYFDSSVLSSNCNNSRTEPRDTTARYSSSFVTPNTDNRGEMISTTTTSDTYREQYIKNQPGSSSSLTGSPTIFKPSSDEDDDQPWNKEDDFTDSEEDLQGDTPWRTNPSENVEPNEGARRTSIANTNRRAPFTDSTTNNRLPSFSSLISVSTNYPDGNYTTSSRDIFHSDKENRAPPSGSLPFSISEDDIDAEVPSRFPVFRNPSVFGKSNPSPTSNQEISSYSSSNLQFCLSESIFGCPRLEPEASFSHRSLSINSCPPGFRENNIINSPSTYDEETRSVTFSNMSTLSGSSCVNP